MPTPATTLPAAVAFPPTHWSVILTAGQGGSVDAAAALAELCRLYWYPLYAFARRQGFLPEDAEDLTQGFFEHLIRHRVIAAADDARGRFRSFLLQCFKHFIASERTRAAAQKRGGGRSLLPLDAERGETQFQSEAADRRDPEVLYERNWAFASDAGPGGRRVAHPVGSTIFQRDFQPMASKTTSQGTSGTSRPSFMLGPARPGSRGCCSCCPGRRCRGSLNGSSWRCRASQEFSPSATNSFFTTSTRCPRRNAFLSASAAPRFLTGKTNTFSCIALERARSTARPPWAARACASRLAHS
jgi:hypothetical protein